MPGEHVDPGAEATAPPPLAVDPTAETGAFGPGSPLQETTLEPAPSLPGELLRAGPQLAGPPSGRVLGDFELQAELARGGMGVVWVARSRRLSRRVALKLLHAEDVGPEARERFQIEARAAARLRHPNIVGVHEVGEAEGTPFLAMDLIEGESLQARLKRAGPLPPREAARIGALLARALAYAHHSGVLHRDVKPANVLLDRQGQPVLTDFGLAKELETPSGGPTRTGQLMGTPAYMSPEQVRGELDQIDRRADVWALGATLYEALCGRVPFQAAATAGLLLKILRDDPPSPRRLRPELDRDLETVVLRCLEKEPEARYPSAQALAEDLERWLSDRPIAARRPGLVERARKWARRNRATAAALAGGATLVLLLIGVGGALHVRELEQARQRADRRAQVALEALRVLTSTAEQELRQIQDPHARVMRRELLQAALEGVRALRRLELEERQSDADTLLRAATAARLAAELSNELGERAEARRSLAEAEAAARALVARAPSRLARRELSMVLDLRGAIHRVAGEVVPARAAWEESRALAEALLAEAPHVLVARRDVASAYVQLVRLEADDGAATRALELARAAVRVRRELCAASPAGPEELADALVQLSAVEHALGDGQAALAAASEAVVWARQALLRGATVLRLHHLVAALNAQGRAWHLLQEPERGRAAQREARLLAEEQHRRDPGSGAVMENLAALLEGEATLSGEEGSAAEGAELAARAVALRRGLLEQDPGEREPTRHLLQALLVQAGAALAEERAPAAVELAGEAVRRAREVVRGPEDVVARAALGEALDMLGRPRWPGAGRPPRPPRWRRLWRCAASSRPVPTPARGGGASC